MRPLTAGLSLLLFGLSACRSEPAADPETSATVEQALTRPLDADIWLARIDEDASGAIVLVDLRVAINRTGYDNQPAFLPDGSGFWFTATDTHDGQSDIWRFDLNGSVARITASAPESEYSAAAIPGGGGLSVVRVEADSTQRLWRFDADGSAEAVLLESVSPVGYYAWSGPNRLALYVLGEPATLRVAELTDRGRPGVVAERIGRSVQPIPGSQDVSFIQLDAGGAATVMRLDPSSGDVTVLVTAVEGGDDHAWTPNGTLLMSREGKIVSWRPGSAAGWQEVADLSGEGVLVTRLAVSPDGTQIALVVEPGRIRL